MTALEERIAYWRAELDQWEVVSRVLREMGQEGSEAAKELERDVRQRRKRAARALGTNEARRRKLEGR